MFGRLQLSAPAIPFTVPVDMELKSELATIRSFAGCGGDRRKRRLREELPRGLGGSGGSHPAGRTHPGSGATAAWPEP
jgi:hypothetical protein